MADKPIQRTVKHDSVEAHNIFVTDTGSVYTTIVYSIKHKAKIDQFEHKSR